MLKISTGGVVEATDEHGEALTDAPPSASDLSFLSLHPHFLPLALVAPRASFD